MPSELRELSSVTRVEAQEPVRPRVVSSRSLSRRLGWCSLVWSIFLFGCADGETSGNPLVLGNDWCSSFCTVTQRCGGGANPSCTNSCLSWSSPYIRRTVRESIEAEAACFRASTDCSSGMDQLFTECFEQAGLAAPPSAASERFCSRLSQTFFECRWFDSPDSCSEVNARYTAPALAAGERCNEAACDELQQCMEASVWSYGEL